MPGITSLPVRTFSPTRRREPVVSATTPFSFSTTTLFITSMLLAVILLPMRFWLARGYGIEPGHTSCLPEHTMLRLTSPPSAHSPAAAAPYICPSHPAQHRPRQCPCRG